MSFETVLPTVFLQGLLSVSLKFKCKCQATLFPVDKLSQTEQQNQVSLPGLAELSLDIMVQAQSLMRVLKQDPVKFHSVLLLQDLLSTCP